MRKFWILALYFVLSNSVFSQEIITIDFDYESFSLKDSISMELNFNQTVETINHYCPTDIQKLCLVAGWFYENIDFDMGKFNSPGEINDYKTVFELKKGICGDYAILFSEFCNRLNIINEIVEGYVPEYNSENKVYYETNHVWNIVKLGKNWYHADLLGFSGFLKMDKLDEYHFLKQINTSNFLTRDLYFLSKHIPADPMWQLSHFPIPLDTLISYGYNAKIDTAQNWFDFNSQIEYYINLPKTEKLVMFADNAFDYNKNNSNVIVVNYYNSAVNLINNWNNDKRKLVKAKEYLEKSKIYVLNAKNGVEVLKDEIDRGLDVLKKFVP